MDILSIIVITLAMAIMLNVLLKKFKISSIVGYIFTGVIIGYFMGV